MILVTFNGMRLCEDGALRVYARNPLIFPSVEEARHKAKGMTVVNVPDHLEIDAAGQVIKDGKIHRLEEFVV